MIAITAQGTTLEAPIDTRFGRCSYFVFFNPGDQSFSGQENPFSSEGSGAGVRTAQFLSDKNIEIILTGNVGPKAMQVLQAAGIKVYTGATKTAREAIEAYQQGKLQQASSPSVEANFGRRKFRGGR